MEDTKSKKAIRRKKVGNSPIPTGPVQSSTCGPCGHSGCETTCRVRFVGPTSHPHDHHILTAARGAANAWTAAIVAGLAIVLTGAIAYAAIDAQAESVQKDQSAGGMYRELARINKRLAVIEGLLRKHTGDTLPTPLPEPKEEDSCAMKCKSIGGDAAAMKQCVSSCPMMQKKQEGENVCMKKCLSETDVSTNSGHPTEAVCRTRCYPQK